MNLDKIYSLREQFSVIGLTGRTGSGCSRVANSLSKKFNELEIRKPNQFKTPSDFSRKYKICYKFANENWKKYRVINYKDVVLLTLLPFGKAAINRELEFWFDSKERPKVTKVVDIIFKKNKNLIKRIEALGRLNEELKDDTKLTELGNIFFRDGYTQLAKEFYHGLNKINIKARLYFCHRISNNLRAFGSPISKHEDLDKNYQGHNISNIYTVAEVINRIIKSLKNIEDDVHIVIDSLKNSIELMFFKERYSAFYMVALNSENIEVNIKKSIKQFSTSKSINQVVKDIIDLDEAEYSDSDFKDGEFYPPDIQNCIQKSDIHINTDERELKTLKKDPNWYKNDDEHLIKYTSLIQHPGLITPNAFERCMQFAYNAKYNSGCISRQVGAVVTDKNYSIKAVGWNDVPQGAVPCLQRDVSDYLKKKGPTDKHAYSAFEKEENIPNVGGKNFRQEFSKVYKHSIKNSSLKGRNCSFCFKSAYNAFEGNDNQVHTRSLHAEENAMLQISKYGGIALHQGNLFTTASPCELCSKKAYQLGIKNIFYIDPYPGISNKHILKGGHTDTHPTLILFSGAVGRAYHKLYEPFMAYKDELSLLTEVKFSVSLNKRIESLVKTKGFDEQVKNKLIRLTKENNLNVKTLNDIISKGLKV